MSQVTEAVTQMDEATQQNAALVEQMAAAAASMRGEAQELVQAVATFQLEHELAGGPRPAIARATPARHDEPATRHEVVPFAPSKRHTTPTTPTTRTPATPTTTTASASARTAQSSAAKSGTDGADEREEF